MPSPFYIQHIVVSAEVWGGRCGDNKGRAIYEGNHKAVLRLVCWTPSGVRFKELTQYNFSGYLILLAGVRGDNRLLRYSD